MRGKVKIIIIAILLTYGFETLSQTSESSFELYTHLNGLSNSHVNCIIQDKKGFMWFGTDYGLNKFDGFKFSTYRNNPKDNNSLPSDEVSALYLDLNGYLWVGSYNGLAKFDHVTEKFENYFINRDSIQYYKPVRAITGDNSGNIWIGTSGRGVLVINIKNGKFLKSLNEELTQLIGNEYVYTLHIDKNNNVWIGTEGNGIIVYYPRTKTVKHLTAENSKLKSNWIITFFEDKPGNIWIGTRGGGLSIINPDKLEFLNTISTDVIKDEVYSITYTRDSSIWIGTKDGGLIIYNPTNKQFTNHLAYASDERFKSKRIRVIYADKDGNIWLGIHQLGISLMKYYNYPFKKSNIKLPPDIRFKNYSVLGILLDSRNNLWLGTDGVGLIKFNINTKQYSYYTHNPADKNSLLSNVVRTVYEDSRQNIWIGTYNGGLSKYKPAADNFNNFVHNPNDSHTLSFKDVVAIAEDKNDRLWIATNGGGLCMFDPDNETFNRYSTIDFINKTTICSDWLTCLFIDKKGILWIGSFWGLSRFDAENLNFKNYYNEPSNLNSLSNNIVFSINEDDSDNIWIGTKNGLNKLNVGKNDFTHYGVTEGLPNEVINSIMKDKDHNFWLASNNGLSKFNYQTIEIKNFNYQDGLIANEFIHNSKYQAPDGQLFLGSVFGFNAFYPDSIKVSEYIPKVYITDFKIFNKSVPIGKTEDGRTILNKSISETSQLKLDYYDNSFSFDFVALDYILPERITYACKMEGFENDWNYLDFKRRFITYTNLDPGTYTFMLKASSRNDEWGEEITTITIHIRPPIWKTSWAYSIFFVLFLAIGLFLWKLLSDRIADKNQLRFERIRQVQVDKLNQEKLEFFTNVSHEFRTPLTLIIGPIENLLEQNKLSPNTKKALQMMSRNAYRLLRLVNQLLDLRKIEKGKLSLQTSESDIIGFISEIYQNFKELAKSRNMKYDFNTNVSELPMYFDHDKMDKIMFNLLSNAFKFTDPNGHIRVKVLKIDEISKEFANGFVQIEIEDNGKGMSPEHVNQIFERFYQSTDNMGSIQRGTGIGLSLTKSLVEIQHGKILVDSTKGEGSVFIVKLPLGKLHLKPNEIAINSNLNSVDAEHQPIVNEEFGNLPKTELDEFIPDESKALILIVEDNEDVRSYIKDGLKNKYRIIEAENGKEGIEKTHEMMPDLIISDVMMPVMDGIKFCKKIKSDLISCHIPVILLTAKTSVEHRIEGLETGADSYIPKPFNPRHLNIRVEKLIELRKKLKEKFRNDAVFEPIQMAVTSTDEKFLKKTIELIKQKIADTDLGVETLGEAVGMSRGHLHRKLKALVGQNPSDFIRTIRLKQAAHLLANENIPVSEVCYLVGFSSPSYFTSCFNKQYGQTPTQYKEKNQKY